MKTVGNLSSFLIVAAHGQCQYRTLFFRASLRVSPLFYIRKANKQIYEAVRMIRDYRTAAQVATIASIACAPQAGFEFPRPGLARSPQQLYKAVKVFTMKRLHPSEIEALSLGKSGVGFPIWVEVLALPLWR